MIQRLIRVLKRPSLYWGRLPSYLAGWYFDLFVREFRQDGGNFLLPRQFTSRYDRGRILRFGYEVPECTLARRHVPSDAVVLELGGCIGVVSCTINRCLARPECHVVVEGNPEIIPHLVANRDRNGCRFEVENAVISDEVSVPFHVSPSMVLSAIGRGEGAVVQIPGVGLADLETKHGLRFDFLVMDIEGAEHRLLMDNMDHLAGRMRGIILERHEGVLGSDRVAEYEGALAARGFRKVETVASVDVFLKKEPPTAANS